MSKFDATWPEWLPLMAVIETPDGHTYEQPYEDF